MKNAIKELNNRKQDELYDRNGPHRYIQYYVITIAVLPGKS